MTQFVISKDGTRIAYSKQGKGSPLVLIDGALCHRNFGANVKLPAFLADHFEVFSYDRRGKGESGNQLPYSTIREFEDLQALIDEIGETPYIYGISSGAALALEAVKHGVQCKKLVVFEAPYMVDNSRPPVPEIFLDTLRQHIQDNEPGKALKYFLKTAVGLPGFVVWMMQWMPAWKKMKALAFTLEYESLLLQGKDKCKPLKLSDWEQVTISTLVISGTKSETWAQNSMKQLAQVLPNAKHIDLKGQNHLVNPKVLAPEMIKFFNNSQ